MFGGSSLACGGIDSDVFAVLFDVDLQPSLMSSSRTTLGACDSGNMHARTRMPMSLHTETRIQTHAFIIEPNLIASDRFKFLFNISFPITDKVDVKGKNAHIIYKWAKENFGNSTVPKWNFHKILINKEGKIQDTFNSFITPLSDKITKKIELAL